MINSNRGGLTMTSSTSATSATSTLGSTLGSKINLSNYKNFVQKVTHVENLTQLVNELNKVKAPYAGLDYLMEKCNGFYAAISFKELLDSYRSMALNTQVNNPIIFKGRSKLDYKITPEQLPKIYNKLYLAEVIKRDLIGSLNCGNPYMLPTTLVNLLNSSNERNINAEKDPFKQSLIFLGELTLLDNSQDFNANSSALRKKDLIADGKQFEFRIFNVYSMEWPQLNLLHLTGNHLIFKTTGVNYKTDSAQLLRLGTGTDKTLKEFLEVNKWEGYVIYTTCLWSPNKRTPDVIALKYPLIEWGKIIGHSYAYTVRGNIITRVKVKLESGKVITLGSGIDDNLRKMLEENREVEVKMKAERRSELGEYIKPVIESYHELTSGLTK